MNFKEAIDAIYIGKIVQRKYHLYKMVDGVIMMTTESSNGFYDRAFFLESDIMGEWEIVEREYA